MSIRSVHLMFITASVAMAVVMTAWFLAAYRAEASAGDLVSALIAAIAGITLGGYGLRYRNKTRNIDAAPHTWSTD